MEHEVTTLGSLLVIIGFFGWIGSAVAFIFKGFDEQNNLISKNALIWGITLVIFYALWITGLKIA